MLSAFRFVSSASLETGEDAKPVSLIDLTVGVQTELPGPAYCATIGIPVAKGKRSARSMPPESGRTS